ncbi:MAG: hypothetical protein GY701_30150 [Sulfitobacter sp.]|nr:hypothetical protein [Sulfitobacter sp.]
MAAMDAAEFNEIFDELIAGPICGVGGWQQGRRVFFTDDTITAAVLRTERRYVPPAHLTLVVRHRWLRDFDGEVPKSPPRDPSEYPVKLPTQEISALKSDDWRYVPYNLGRWPFDVVPYRSWSHATVREAFDPLGKVLAYWLPRVSELLPAERMLERLRADGEDAWCEQRWIEDLEAFTAS